VLGICDVFWCSHNGFFDVAYDDGGYDYNLPRHRLRLDNVFGPNVLPADASNVAQRRMRSKLVRRFKRRRAYEKRVKKGAMIKKQFGTNASPQIGFVAPVETLVEPLNRTAGIAGGDLNVDTAAGTTGELAPASESESESDSDGSEWEWEESESVGGGSVGTGSVATAVSSASASTAQVERKRVKKHKWPAEDRRPHYQLYRYQPYDKETFTPTVMPDPEQGWHLVYAGPDTSYACTNLIPDSVLAEEPNMSIPVAFIVQTCGSEYPSLEHSLCSDPLIVWTESPKVLDDDGDDETIATRESTVGGSAASTANAEEPLKKRHVIHAMVDGVGRIEIEKRHHYYLSTGVSDHYF